jgi:hypothetical protein
MRQLGNHHLLKQQDKSNYKGFFMTKTCSEGLLAGPQPNDFKIRKLLVSLGNTYVRCTPAERRNIMRALKTFAFGKAKSISLYDTWSEDDAKTCDQTLKAISPKMANDFRRWAAELLRDGRNIVGNVKRLEDELVVRASIEEP